MKRDLKSNLLFILTIVSIVLFYLIIFTIFGLLFFDSLLPVFRYLALAFISSFIILVFLESSY